ncbi:LAME_0F07910g1_1 [Lachancea meyersii CBS 8951]|uniref:Telomere replication protein EST3 n=1 Tax=Lachancea meyersii CBS 8951 TaxID=1266667 RepID=A0A1G4JUC0_9SACH|nr:LAME_0F07910g1_1 [Lachancea meyersii CBS 8951]
MSKVIVSYKKKQNESFYLRSWIVRDVQELVAIHATYPAWPVIKKFVPPFKTTGSSVFNSQNLQNARHFVKVTGFHKIDNYTVSGSVRDDCCHILVEFSPTCVADFERHHGIRITSQTVNTIFLIGDVTLKFVPVRELRASGKWSLNFDVDSRVTAVPVLVINRCQAFDLDQVEARLRFPFLYQLESFIEKFRSRPGVIPMDEGC